RLNVDSIAQLFEVRCLVEGMAARIAAMNVTDAAVSELETINEKVRSAIRQGDLAEVLRANQEFHFAIYRLTRSDVLLPIIEGLWLRCGPTMCYSLGSPGLWDLSSHVAVLRALAQRNPAAAEVAMREDIAKTADYL